MASTTKEFREFFTRHTQVNSGAKPDQETGFPLQYTINVNGSTKTVYNRFQADDFPSRDVFSKLFNSIAFILNSEDTATTSQQGLAKKATDAKAQAGNDSDTDSMQLFTAPSQLPNVTAVDTINGLDTVTVAVNTSGSNNVYEIEVIPAAVAGLINLGDLADVIGITSPNGTINIGGIYPNFTIDVQDPLIELAATTVSIAGVTNAALSTTDLSTLRVDAGELASNGDCVEITAALDLVASAYVKTIGIDVDEGPGTRTTKTLIKFMGAGNARLHITFTRASTSAGVLKAELIGASAKGDVLVKNCAFDVAQDNDIIITGYCTDASVITLHDATMLTKIQ